MRRLLSIYSGIGILTRRKLAEFSDDEENEFFFKNETTITQSN